METLSKYLCKYKGYVFAKGETTQEYIDSLQQFEIRDSDVFLVTYPKSDHITNSVKSCIFLDAGTSLTDKLEQLMNKFSKDPLSAYMSMVIYVRRNPKDNAVSYFHFSHVWAKIETPDSFEQFLETYLAGNVGGASWFDHVQDWYNESENYDILFLTYEEMVLDLRTAVEKISKFLGRNLDETTIAGIVEKATFKNMKQDSKANYEFLPDTLLLKPQFMRKGTIGDWKNTFTVAQNEMFDHIFQERMKNLPLDFIWDLNNEQ